MESEGSCQGFVGEVELIGGLALFYFISVSEIKSYKSNRAAPISRKQLCISKGGMKKRKAVGWPLASHLRR